MEIDWPSVISALSGILAGGGVMQLFNLRAAKRKAAAEARQAEAEAAKVEAEGKNMISDSEHRFIDQIQEQTERYSKMLREKDEKIDKMYTDLRNAENKVTICSSSLCVHHACGARKPGKGLGLKWIIDHINETDLAGDYDSTEQIFKDYITKEP